MSCLSDMYLCAPTYSIAKELRHFKLDENPPPQDEATIKSLLVGEAVHRRIQELLGTDEYDHEQEIVWTSHTGIQVKAHPDIIHRQTKTVIELKTTNSTKAIEDEPDLSHLKQIKTHMSILDYRIGNLG
jgi:hypothetical protein